MTKSFPPNQRRDQVFTIKMTTTAVNDLKERATREGVGAHTLGAMVIDAYLTDTRPRPLTAVAKRLDKAVLELLYAKVEPSMLPNWATTAAQDACAKDCFALAKVLVDGIAPCCTVPSKTMQAVEAAFRAEEPDGLDSLLAGFRKAIYDVLHKEFGADSEL